jgi:hypothetical protein
MNLEINNLVITIKFHQNNLVSYDIKINLDVNNFVIIAKFCSLNYQILIRYNSLPTKNITF